MSIAKVIEVSAQSTKGFEDAMQEAVSRTGETIENIQSAWVKDQEVLVEGGKINAYRVTLKVTFIVKP